MAAVKIYTNGNPVEVEDGAPPVDQSAEVAALTQQVADLQAANAKLQGKLDQLAVEANARVAADAASVDGQKELDIINAP